MGRIFTRSGRIVFVVLAGLFCSLTSTAAAQTADPCDGPLNPYVAGGNPELAAYCGNRPNVGPPTWTPPPGCIRPYPGQEPLLCPPTMSAAAVTALTRDYAMRYSIAQGSIGQPGRTLVYVNLHSLEDVPQEVVIEYSIHGRPGTYLHYATLAPKDHHSIGLHTDPVFAGKLNFSVAVYFAGAGTVELTSYREPDVETDAKVGVLVARSPTP